jgi:hypothetical protein
MAQWGHRHTHQRSFWIQNPFGAIQFGLVVEVKKAKVIVSNSGVLIRTITNL